ncbi:MAG: CCA tRNA nucleotidyltransferase [Candidatus Micrarchaeia archaeon]
MRSNSLSESLDDLQELVLKIVKPSKSEIERTTALANMVMERLKKVVPKGVEIILAGSVARGTQIRGSSDIDIFILFPKNLEERKMEMKGIEVAKRIVSKNGKEHYVVKYAEHPYIQVFFDDYGMNVDIVPAYKINSAKERGSAVDRTQLHNLFINDNLTPRQKDEVKVLKAFLKEHNIYGAEARVSGFSGYLCELLIYQFGSFVEFLKGISSIKLPFVAEPLHREFKGADDANLIAKKFNSKFIVIDPTDPERNVAANVSMESLSRLVLASRLLLKEPSKKTFFRKPYSDINSRLKLESIAKKLNLEIIAVKIKVPNIADDIIWQQVQKLKRQLEQHLAKEGFAPEISLQNLYDNYAVIAFFTRRSESGASVKEGPNVFMKSAVDNFMDSHNDALFTVHCDRIGVLSMAQHKSAFGLLKWLINSGIGQMPSYIKRNNISIVKGAIDEQASKAILQAYMEKFSI